MGDNSKYLLALSIGAFITFCSVGINTAAAQSLAKGSGAASRSSLLEREPEAHPAPGPSNSSPANLATANNLVSISSVPVDHRIRIVVSDPAFFGSSATITDQNGQLMQELSLKHVTSVDAKNWSAGIYTLRLVDGSTHRIDHH